MQIISVLMALGLVALGLLFVLTILQFGVLFLAGIVTAIVCAYTALVKWIRERCN